MRAIVHVLECAAIIGMFACFIVVLILTVIPPYDAWTILKIAGLVVLSSHLKEVVADAYGWRR